MCYIGAVMDSIDEYLGNFKAQMRKGILEFSILLIINQEGEIYAPDILKALKKLEMIVVEGTLYPLLSRLKSDELLSYTWEESRNGPPRKYYSLTPKGKTFLEQLIPTWKSLSKAITSLLRSHE